MREICTSGLRRGEALRGLAYSTAFAFPLPSRGGQEMANPFARPRREASSNDTNVQGAGTRSGTAIRGGKSFDGDRPRQRPDERPVPLDPEPTRARRHSCARSDLVSQARRRRRALAPCTRTSRPKQGVEPNQPSIAGRWQRPKATAEVAVDLARSGSRPAGALAAARPRREFRPPALQEI